MTNQEKKEYLLGYQYLNQRINRLLLEQQQWRELATRVSPVSYTHLNHKREICNITGEILPFAELKIDEDCPLKDAGEEGCLLYTSSVSNSGRF